MPSVHMAGKVAATKIGKLLPLLAVAVALGPACLAVRARQNPLPPISSPGQIGPKPPTGAGGCSITAPTCADVAPIIIRKALGPSPLGRNVRLLAAMLAGGKKGPDSDERVAQWAAEAFRKAGADAVHVEKFTLPAGSASGAGANVVAVIHGRTQASEFVILGAALDARDSASARLAAACNVALVIDAAHAIHGAGIRPLRSIRFVLFGGTVQGKAASRAYVRSHRAELDRADAVVVYDAGDAPVAGYDLEARKSLAAPLRKALAPAAQFGADDFTDKPAMENAAFGFVLEGVPTIVTNPHGQPRSPRKMDLPALKRSVALSALAAYGIADLPQRLGVRLTRAQIRRRLGQSGLENEMKTEGTGSRRGPVPGSGQP